MLTFLTVVRHPANSRSYERVWKLLGDTVASQLAQRDRAIRVVIVCNEPLPLVDDERVHLVTVDWPPVAHQRLRAEWGVPAQYIDKGTKMTVGLSRIRELGSDHVMIVDADDFVADDVSEFVNANPGANGWFVDRGYLLTPRALTPLDDFNTFCGSSHIIALDLLEKSVPQGLDPSWPVDLVIDATDRDFLIRMLGDHQEPSRLLAEARRPLEPYPERAVVWQLGTGENVSDFTQQSRAWMLEQQRQPGIATELRQRFSIPAARMPVAPTDFPRPSRLKSRAQRSIVALADRARPPVPESVEAPVQVLYTLRGSAAEVLPSSYASVQLNLRHEVERVTVVCPPALLAAVEDAQVADEVVVERDFLVPGIVDQVEMSSSAFDKHDLLSQIVRLSANRLGGCDAVLTLESDSAIGGPRAFLEGDRHVWFATGVPADSHVGHLHRVSGGRLKPPLLDIGRAQMIYSQQALTAFQESVEAIHPGRSWEESLLDALDPAEPDPMSDRLLYAAFTAHLGEPPVRKRVEVDTAPLRSAPESSGVDDA